MGNRGRRFDEERRLNYKKVFAVIVCIAVVIMVAVSIIKTIQEDKDLKQPVVKNYFPVYADNKWGVIDEQGNIIIDPTYEELIIIPNKEKPIFITTYDVNELDGTYKTKVINDKNEELFKEYDTCEAIDNYDSKQNIWYEDNSLKVSKNGKYGLINLEKNELLKCEYEDITALKGVTSNIIVKKDGKIGMVNEKGQIVIPVEYKEILTLKEGYKSEYIIIDENNKYGLISTSGTIIFEPKYDSIKYINSSEVYVVKEEGVLKLVNTNGEAIINGQYDDITHSKGDYTIIVKEGKYGVITKDGTEKIAPLYQDLKYAFGTYYIAKKDNKYGIINLENETAVDFAYTNMIYVENGGFIQADVSELETAIFDNSLIQRFTGIISEVNKDKGYIKVYADNDYKYYNFKFEEKKSYDILTSNTIFLSKKDGQYGYVDKNGGIVVDYIYDDGTEQNQYGYVAVKKDGVWGSLNKIGNIVLEPSVNLDNNIYMSFIGKWHLSDTGLYYTK